MKNRRIVKGFGILLFIVIAVAGFGEAVLHLWNWLMPEIFGWKAISFSQALGLMALSWILFRGGFMRMPHMARPHHRQMILDRLTPEERERIEKGLQGWRGGRCGPKSA